MFELGIKEALTKKIDTVLEKEAKEGAKIAENTSNNGVENIKLDGEVVLEKLNDIKNLTFEQLMEKMKENFNKYNDENISESDNLDDTKEDNEGLTDKEKAKIKEETGWSDEIIDAIGSMEEYEIYKSAGLIEAEVGGKKCLIRNDIDWEQKDAMGRTNKERAEQGLSPINKDGKVIELHHIGQHIDSPLAELTPEEHRGKGNDIILHDKTKESEIDRNAFAVERNIHWGARANTGGDL